MIILRLLSDKHGNDKESIYMCNENKAYSQSKSLFHGTGCHLLTVDMCRLFWLGARTDLETIFGEINL